MTPQEHRAKPQDKVALLTKASHAASNTASGQGAPSAMAHDATSATFASQRRGRVRPRLVVAAVAAGLTLVFGTFVLIAWRGFVPLAKARPLTAMLQMESAQNKRLEDILRAQKQLQKEPLWEPLPLFSPSHEVGPKVRPKAHSGLPATPVKAAAKGSRVPVSDPASAYFRAYGTPDHFAALNGRPSGLALNHDEHPEAQAQNRGMVLAVRLSTEAASEPAASPVIAILRRPAQLGQAQLPAGTEMHGLVRGPSSAGDRVFIDFNFVRLASGQSCDISGHAQDVQGRLGVPGRRHLTGATAQSVGIASAGRAAGVAGRELAGSIGRVLGAGVEGAVESGSDKARRIDRDESIVVATRHTTFNIYLTHAHCD